MNQDLASCIDHTILKPFAREADIIRLCEEAAAYRFASVCVNPCHVFLARKRLEGTGVKVCTVVGFPLGANITCAKAFEARKAVEDGAEELDMVINIGALKDGNYNLVREDIKAVVDAAPGKTIKVIIETVYLSDDEIVRATQLSCEAGANFVKTCTGFNEGVATVENVKLIADNCAPGVKVKASAGVKTLRQAKALLEAGAQRLGTSSGIQLISEIE